MLGIHIIPTLKHWLLFQGRHQALSNAKIKTHMAKEWGRVLGWSSLGVGLSLSPTIPTRRGNSQAPRLQWNGQVINHWVITVSLPLTESQAAFCLVPTPCMRCANIREPGYQLPGQPYGGLLERAELLRFEPVPSFHRASKYSLRLRNFPQGHQYWAEPAALEFGPLLTSVWFLCSVAAIY